MLYIKNPDTESIEKFLLNAFSDRGGKCKETFTDPNFIHEDCHVARRSFEDIVELVNTYFPEATKEEIAYKLLTMPNYCGFFCYDIKKWVSLKNVVYDFYVNTDFQYYKGNGDYSFNEIVKLAYEYPLADKELLDNLLK